jgi:hypothetical protein
MYQNRLKRLKEWIKLIRIVKPLRTRRKMRNQPMLAYPPILPLDAASLVAEIVKGRTIQARKVEFAHALWNVQGYVQKVTLGDPTILPGASLEDLGIDPMTFEQIMEILLDLEADLDEFESEGVMMGAGNDEEAQQEAICIITIISIVGAVLQAIQLWRNRNKEALTDTDMDDLPAVG